ncbi:MAG: hypothetical protein J5I98_30920 [Phaeodactylibacter sp.]|nr:hypothetical protein [Phaeodactylibacter sp.]
MAFKDEAQELSFEKRRLLNGVVARWANKNRDAAKALYDDRFLPQPEMEYLANRLAEYSAYLKYQKIDALEAELRRHCGSWLQLKGRKIIQELIPGKVGTFIPESQLRNHLLKQHSSLFLNEAFLNNFFRGLDERKNPAAWIAKYGCADIRIRADHELAWYYWDSEGHFENILAALEAIVQRDAQKPGAYILLVFSHSGADQDAHPSSGKGLHRPSWGDYGLARDKPLRPCRQGRFGLIGVGDGEAGSDKASAAAAVGRSAFLRLADLEYFKIKHL